MVNEFMKIVEKNANIINMAKLSLTLVGPILKFLVYFLKNVTNKLEKKDDNQEHGVRNLIFLIFELLVFTAVLFVFGISFWIIIILKWAVLAMLVVLFISGMLCMTKFKDNQNGLKVVKILIYMISYIFFIEIATKSLKSENMYYSMPILWIAFLIIFLDVLYLPISDTILNRGTIISRPIKFSLGNKKESILRISILSFYFTFFIIYNSISRTNVINSIWNGFFDLWGLYYLITIRYIFMNKPKYYLMVIDNKTIPILRVKKATDSRVIYYNEKRTIQMVNLNDIKFVIEFVYICKVKDLFLNKFKKVSFGYEESKISITNAFRCKNNEYIITKEETKKILNNCPKDEYERFFVMYKNYNYCKIHFL